MCLVPLKLKMPGLVDIHGKPSLLGGEKEGERGRGEEREGLRGEKGGDAIRVM